MTQGDDRLVEEVEAAPAQGQSMDVLLQLTLPMVLILAFLVVTEVQTMTDQISRLKRDITNTATGRLSRERDTTLMELQLQLLYQATDQIAQAEEEALSLREYGLVAPSAAEILRGEVSPRFVTTSRQLDALLNGEQHRAATEQRLRLAIEERFSELVDAELSEFDATARNKVLSVAQKHRTLYQTKLDGHLQAFESVGTAVQLDVMLRWLEHPDVASTLQPDSLSLWKRIQVRLRSEEAEPAEGGLTDVPFDDFVNLRVLRLVHEFSTLHVPLLDRATREAQL
jgi:hypothetical protein